MLDERLLVFVCNLVELFVNVCKRFFFFDENKDICILDEEGIFFLIWMLCFDDSKLLLKGKLLKFIYLKIREVDVRVFGV